MLNQQLTYVFPILRMTVWAVAIILGTASSSEIIAQGQDASTRKIDFSRDIRPLLSNACFSCHGPDNQTREADLRLDTEDGLFLPHNDRHIIKRNSPAESELVQRITSTDPDVQMPPPNSKKTLNEAQRKLLIEWIAEGAPWSQHWAFVAPIKPDVPDFAVPPIDGWPRNEIDHFLGNAQRNQQLHPSPQADVYTLLRRVYLDLIGLPPTVEEADTWVKKLQPNHPNAATNGKSAIGDAAWQALVDELMGRPEYGERWARPWLDLARYADTNGYEKDRERSIWPFRDWVINAINSDMPFDQFTIEQLAGDMLPDATQSQRIATGFHRNTMLNEEGGIDPLEFRFHAMTDRVATTGTTWLGLTTGCAQCHTHKYDPITHRNYYQLMAFLNNADEPSLELPGPDFENQWQANKRQADKLQRELPQKWPLDDAEKIPSEIVFAEVTGKVTVEASKSGGPTIPEDSDSSNTPDSKAATTIRKMPNQWLSPVDSKADSATYVIELDVKNANFDQVKLSLRTGKNRQGPGNSQGGNFVLSEVSFSALLISDDFTAETNQKNANGINLPIRSARGSVEQPGYELEKAFDGNDTTGWGIHGPVGVPKTADATFKLDLTELQSVLSAAKTDFSSEAATVRLRITMVQQYGHQHTIGEFHLQAARSRSDEESRALREMQIEAAFSQWLKTEQSNAVSWQIMTPVEAHASLPTLTIQADNSIFASGDTAKRDDYFVSFAALNEPITALRLEALPDERLPARGPGTTYYEGTLGDFYLTELKAKSPTAELPFASATETYAKNRFGSSPATAAMAIDGDVQSGWAVHDRQGERHVAVFALANPIPAGAPLTVHMTFGRHFASSLGRFRFSGTSAHHATIARDYSEDIVNLLLLPDEQLSEADRDALRREFLLSAPQLSGEVERIRKLRMRPAVPESLVMQERPTDHPRPTFRHHRGEYLQPEEEVSPEPPEILHPWPATLPRNRLGFAKWLMSPENPLTARVVVNRHWAAFFGRGIVSTIDDFGMQGSPPNHPELLDWLAVTFMSEDKWSVKQLHRRIVMSAAYRQSSVHRPDAAAIDPENRLLTFMPRLRLEAEIIRDSMLQASGTLSHKRGGVPVRPPQPDGVTEVAYGGQTWNPSAGEDRYRRSIYTFIKRTAPFAMITTFDGPSGEACVANRSRSNTPLQALTLLNDVMFVDMAQKASHQMLRHSEAGTDEEYATRLFRQLLTRHPDQDELASLLAFVQEQRAVFRRSPELTRQLASPAEKILNNNADNVLEQAVWTTVARALFGLDEAVTRP